VAPREIPEHLMARRRAVGVRIREAREGRQWSQERLAEHADLARVTVVRIELGLQAARLDHLFLIADALGVPLSVLVRE
jgi:transcriptional regulator with XRE-family HTH domain